VHAGKSAAEKQQALQTLYGDNALKTAAVCDWYSHFKILQELLEHKPLQWETFNFCEC
jgi:hypothetical protein